MRSYFQDRRWTWRMLVAGYLIALAYAATGGFWTIP